ncbi:MAG: NAD(P)/FAD-dependent oxidoreductase [Bacilli bacterium]|nr:NAD(P)/FAD-dependent oxidoreductase [Bacilli bacterium]
MIYDSIIVGGGASGMSAALYLLRNNKSVLVLEKENFGGQIANSPKVENFPSIKEISGLDFSDHLFQQIVDLGASFELEDVESIKKDENGIFLVTTNYNEYQSKTVVLANGVKHRLMNLPREDDFIGNGISFCAVCDGPMLKGKEAYLIGDANTAMQYAILLTDYCTKVHMFTLFDHFFGDQILIDKVKANSKIFVTHNMNLLEYKGEDKLTGLVFENTIDKNKREYQTDNVFICIGQIPQNDRFADLLVLDKGYVITNEDMETKTPGLYAVGDTRKKGVRQLVTACNDGAIAALSIIKYLS